MLSDRIKTWTLPIYKAPSEASHEGFAQNPSAAFQWGAWFLKVEAAIPSVAECEMNLCGYCLVVKALSKPISVSDLLMQPFLCVVLFPDHEQCHLWIFHVWTLKMSVCMSWWCLSRILHLLLVGGGIRLSWFSLFLVILHIQKEAVKRGHLVWQLKYVSRASQREFILMM